MSTVLKSMFLQINSLIVRKLCQQLKFYEYFKTTLW
jgi:hypothetical protein